jgi:hypothetical protein
VEDLIVAAFPIVDLVSQGSWFGAFAAAVDACRARTDPAGRWAIITELGSTASTVCGGS